MILANLPARTRVFVDANIIALHMTQKSDLAEACSAFLRRVRKDRIQAFTSVIVVAEVIHRVMISEAVGKLNLPPRKAVGHLKAHPNLVMDLSKHLAVPSKVYQMGISIEPVTRVDLHTSRLVRKNYGLMTNDSLIVAVMQRLKLVHLVTNDDDFKRVNGITIWKPLG